MEGNTKPTSIVINGTTYYAGCAHPFVDQGCKLSQDIIDKMYAGHPDVQNDKTFETCRSKFDNLFQFSGFLVIPDEQFEMFPNEHMCLPLTFSKLCLQFCGDSCDCGKKDFLDSYTKPYETP